MNRTNSRKRLRALVPRATQSVSALVDARLKQLTELNHFEQQGTGSPYQLQPQMTQLSDISQGVTDGNRVGDRLNVESLRIAQTIKEHPSSGKLTNSRILVVQSHAMSMAWGTANFQTEVLGGLNSLYQHIAPTSHDKRAQFKVLQDSGPIPLSSNVAQSAPALRNAVIELKAKSVIQYSNGSANEMSNAIQLLVMTDAGISQPLDLTFSVDLRFRDY